MLRRSFVTIPLAAPALAQPAAIPKYKVVTSYPAAGNPNRYPAVVADVHHKECIDETTRAARPEAVRAKLAAGMTALTGKKDPRDAWRSFFSPQDVVALKVNASGSPRVMSDPVLVGETHRALREIGVPAKNIFVFERFKDQLDNAHYERHVPEESEILAIEWPRRSLKGFDPKVYVEVNLFGEEDTRSNMARVITERATKVINFPNMKDHGASGVTGCLKNIAYGSFHNVARSHEKEKTHTLSFIGTLAGVEPLRSKTTLHLMDGFKAIWHGGPFVLSNKYVFFPKRLMVTTDPVAADRLLIDIIDGKRKQEGAVSVWDRSLEYVKEQPDRENPNQNRFLREPGHIEYAAKLGLGTYDIKKIQVRRIDL